MYPTSDAYKSTVSSLGRDRISAQVIFDGQTITSETDLQSMEITRDTQTQNALFGNAIAKSATYTIIDKGLTAYTASEGDEVQTKIGIRLGDGSLEYIPFTPMYIVKVDRDTVKKMLKITCDDGLQFAKRHTISELPEQAYPTTLRSYLNAVCVLCGFSLSDESFLNESLILESAPNLSGSETCQSVIGWAAQAALSNAVMNRNGELQLIPIVKSWRDGDPIINTSNYISFSAKSRFGPINALVLSRSPQEDNVYRRDEESIATNGLTEYRIDNNPFLDYGNTDKRYDVIDSLFDTLNGYTFWPFETTWQGDPAMDEGDRIKLLTVDGIAYETTYHHDKLTYNGGLRAASGAIAPDSTTTSYQYGVTQRDVKRQTEIRTDKVNAEITAIVKTTESIGNTADAALEAAQSNSTLIQQVAEGLTVAVSTTGGNNLLKGTSGRQGLLDWTLSEGGSAMGGTANDTTSGGYIRVTDGQLSQSFRLILGQEYAYCYKYRLDGSGSFSIAGIDQPLVESDRWRQVQGTFTAQGQDGEAVITATPGSFVDIADLIVIQGAGVSVWRQAPNEVVTATMTVDDRGTTWSKEGEPYEAHADNTQFEVRNKDTDTRIAYMDKDGAQLYNTTIKNQFTVQREGTSSSALRIIPVADGAMFVIND